MAVPIAELFVAIGADISGAMSGFNQLDQRLKGTAGAFQRAAPAARALTVAGGALTAGFVDAIRVGSDFESAMSGVRAQLKPAELEAFRGSIRDLARDLGKQTKFSAKEAAQGIEELLKLGIPVQDVLGGAAKAALDLAVATGTDVANAGAIAASAMNAFGLETKDLDSVVQILAGVSVTTAADMNDMRLALSDVGATAGAVGLSFKDTATAIGLFRDVGFTGNTAGTALKTMLVGLQPQTAREVKLFKELNLVAANGTSIFFDAAGNIKDLADIADILRAKFGHLTRAQRLHTFQMIFGTQGMQAANAVFEAGSDTVRRYAAEIAGIDPRQAAATRMDNLRGDLEKLRSAFQDIQIEISDAFTPGLRTMVQRMTKALDVINDWNPQMKKMAAQTTLTAAVIATLTGGFVLMAPFLAALPGAFAVLTAIIAAMSPVLLAVAAAGVFLARAWERNMFGMRDQAIAAFTNPTPYVEAFISQIGQIIFHVEELARAFGQATQPLQDHAQTVGQIALVIGQSEEPIKELGHVLRLLAGSANNANESIIPMGGAAAGGIVSLLAFQGALAVVAQFAGLLGRVLPFLRVVLTGLGGPIGIAVALVGALAGAFVAAYTTNDKFRARVDGLVASLAPLAELLGRVGQSIADFVSENFNRFVEFVATFDPLVEFAGPLSFLADVLDKVGRVLGYLGEQLGPAIQPLMDAFVANMPQITEALGRLGQVIQTEFLQAAEQMGPLLTSLSNFFSAFGQLLGVVAERGGSALQQMFEQVLVPGVRNLATALSELVPFIAPFLKFLAGLVERTDLAGLLANTAKEFNAVAEAIRKLSNILSQVTIPDWLQQFLLAQAVPLPMRGLVPGNPAGNTGPVITPTAFGGGPASSATITIGTVNIGSEVDADMFLSRMAEIISGSAARVEPPVDSQTPAMIPQPVLS